MDLDFAFDYDENLMENSFFVTLRKEYEELFLKVVAENCIICVPKTDSFPKCTLAFEDFLSHILVPTDELPESHFLSLCGVKVKISNRILTIDSETGRQSCIQILFQETFYTEEGLKYEVLCVGQPLDESIASDVEYFNGKVLKNFKDCLDFLWTETKTHETIENIDKEVDEFLKKFDKSQMITLQFIEESFNSLYKKCIQVLFKNPNIRKKYKNYSSKTLKIALETYLQQGTYKKIIRSIALCTSTDDAKLNKHIRNLSDLPFKDFKLDPIFFNNIPKARLELSKINGYFTVIDKLRCLKQTAVALSKFKNDKALLNADNLLQILTFLIIKSNLPNWNAQLKFLKLFYSSNNIFDESNYLIVSLEAAITYIQSGNFQESESKYKLKNNLEKNSIQYGKSTLSQEQALNEFFHFVTVGDLENVKDIIENGHKKVENSLNLKLCHPLCFCDKCRVLFNHFSEVLPSVTSADEKNLTALHIASMNNVPNVVEYLINKGGDCNAFDCEGRTPAHYAALKGHQNALLLLLHNNAHINAEDNSFNTPLHLCSNNGHDNCVKALIYFSEYSGVKLKVNSQNSKGDTPLHYASKWGFESIVRHLLEFGANPNILNRNKNSPLDYSYNDKILQLLKQKSQNFENTLKVNNRQLSSLKFKEQSYRDTQPNAIDTMKKIEKIFRAIEIGDVNLVCFYFGFDASDFVPSASDNITLLKNKERENYTRCHPLCACKKCTALIEETSREDKTISFSHKKTINLNTCNSDGYTALHVASKAGKIDLVKGFIKNGAGLNVQTSSKKWTPLMLAVQNQRLDVVKELLNTGCKIDVQDYKLNTALHYACRTGNSKLVKILLKYEPDTNLKNIDNKTPLQEAKDQLYLGIIQIFKGRPLIKSGD
ncbi:ankyrin repeat-containing protein, putative [Pediculus humanus corporis]|uniref:Ankyrin repeat-containing protein, putative n=1 Tax=Pediculus humanus subsp. corporis TaxID=121224 RepID=E0VNS2_PEDHC|nr:ankyrin repeat-containing protein, putative [Pediculus humanus corporis]EEB15028.1 ankyrin repeat-containing protein, putative [Pediculus humanus corporis]